MNLLKKVVNPLLNILSILRSIDRSAWIEAGYNEKSKKVQIPLANFNPDRVSFTYPDSMISYWLKSQTEQAFYHPEYHGEVFRLSEIEETIDLVFLIESGKQIHVENTIFS